jgi:hypothetical protein
MGLRSWQSLLGNVEGGTGSQSHTECCCLQDKLSAAPLQTLQGVADIERKGLRKDRVKTGFQVGKKETEVECDWVGCSWRDWYQINWLFGTEKEENIKTFISETWNYMGINSEMGKDQLSLFLWTICNEQYEGTTLQCLAQHVTIQMFFFRVAFTCGLGVQVLQMWISFHYLQ